MVKERAYHHPVVLFTKDNAGADKPFTVVNLQHVRFIGGPSKQGITGNIQGACDPDKLIAVITSVGVLTKEVLLDIGMNSSKSVIH